MHLKWIKSSPCRRRVFLVVIVRSFVEFEMTSASVLCEWKRLHGEETSGTKKIALL